MLDSSNKQLFTIFFTFLNQTINQLIEKIICKLIINKNVSVAGRLQYHKVPQPPRTDINLSSVKREVYVGPVLMLPYIFIINQLLVQLSFADNLNNNNNNNNKSSIHLKLFI